MDEKNGLNQLAVAAGIKGLEAMVSSKDNRLKVEVRRIVSGTKPGDWKVVDAESVKANELVETAALRVMKRLDKADLEPA